MAGLVINTNLAAMSAQKNLGMASRGLGSSIEKLSSGLRINRASDDAAGLAISEGLKAKISSYGQALRNANDAISLTQVGEGALSEVNNILNRMRELALQSSNSTLGSSERNTVHDEYQSLKNEISRIASVTEFVGLKLLDSSTAAGLSMQIGLNSGTENAITVSGVDARTTQLGSIAANNEYDWYSASVMATTATILVYQGGALIGSMTTVAGVVGDNISVVTSALSASISDATALLSDVINVTGANATTRIMNGAATFDQTYTGAITVSIVPAGGSGLSTISAVTESVISGYTSLENTAISVQSMAQAAISVIDAAISTVTSKRGAFGAAQNRLLSTISNITVNVENLASANSSIRDVDFATETATFTKFQVIQQAATAVLAQARTIPQTALTLLR